MFRNDVVTHDLLYQQHQQNDAPQPQSTQTPLAKKVHRAREIAQQKVDCDDVEEDPERAAQAIVRRAIWPFNILDGHFHHPRAVKTSQRGDEAMQLAVKIDLFQYLGAVGLKSGAEIVYVHA